MPIMWRKLVPTRTSESDVGGNDEPCGEKCRSEKKISRDSR